MTDRAASEVVGFVLIVSLIVSTVGVVYAVGLGGLQDARNAERVDNAERAFDVFADNMADIYKRDAPSRATEIKLADASLQFGEPTVITVNYTGSGATYGRALTPIVYEAGTGTKLVYEGGAVIRSQRDGAVMLREPDAVFTNLNGSRVAIVPIVQTRPDGTGGSVAGTTTVLVRADGAITGFLTSNSSGGPYDLELTVETTPTRARVWMEYLNSEIPGSWDNSGDGVPCDKSSGTVTCLFATDEVYVPRTGIDVQFS